MEDVQFKDTFPGVPSSNYMFMLEAMTYKCRLVVKTNSNVDPNRALVQAWTNQYDTTSCDGTWHAVNLELIEVCEAESSDFVHLTYGQSIVITSACDFEFTFRAKLENSRSDAWVWASGWQRNGFAHVEPPRKIDKWTLGPDYDHILDSLHLGNFIAATNAAELGFTHVLNVADNLDMVNPSDSGVLYKKVPMTDGACNPIEESKIREAVDWLCSMNSPGKTRILVNCRAGIGRAGSVAVAFVFRQRQDFSFEDAKMFVFEKRFVYPHKNLECTLYKLYRS